MQLHCGSERMKLVSLSETHVWTSHTQPQVKSVNTVRGVVSPLWTRHFMYNVGAEFDRWSAADWPSQGRGGAVLGGLSFFSSLHN